MKRPSWTGSIKRARSWRTHQRLQTVDLLRQALYWKREARRIPNDLQYAVYVARTAFKKKQEILKLKPWYLEICSRKRLAPRFLSDANWLLTGAASAGRLDVIDSFEELRLNDDRVSRSYSSNLANGQMSRARLCRTSAVYSRHDWRAIRKVVLGFEPFCGRCELVVHQNIMVFRH